MFLLRDEQQSKNISKANFRIFNKKMQSLLWIEISSEILFWLFSGHSLKLKSKFILQVADIFHINLIMKWFKLNYLYFDHKLCTIIFKVAKKSLSNSLSLIYSPGQITISQLIENMLKKCLLKEKSFANRQVSWKKWNWEMIQPFNATLNNLSVPKTNNL